METNPYLLAVTMIVTLVHTVFEFLAFKNGELILFVTINIINKKFFDLGVIVNFFFFPYLLWSQLPSLLLGLTLSRKLWVVLSTKIPVIIIQHGLPNLLVFVLLDIQFWRSRKTLEGLSVRSVFFNVFQSVIVLLYVMDNETNTVIVISCFVGLFIEIWKINKAVDIKVCI